MKSPISPNEKQNFEKFKKSIIKKIKARTSKFLGRQRGRQREIFLITALYCGFDVGVENRDL